MFLATIINVSKLHEVKPSKIFMIEMKLLLIKIVLTFTFTTGVLTFAS